MGLAQNEVKAKPALPERVRSMEGLGRTRDEGMGGLDEFSKLLARELAMRECLACAREARFARCRWRAARSF